MHAVLKGVLVICGFFIYLAIGAAIFTAIERPAEEDRARVANERKNEIVANLTSYFNLNDSAVNVTALQTFLDQYYEAESKYQAARHENWFYGPAIFFCVTVVTTIGYGNISPSTPRGQTFCVLYALAGIPFTAYMLAMIGGYYGKIYNYLENHVTSRLEQKHRSERRRKIVKWSFVAITCCCNFIFFFSIPAIVFTAVEDWTYRESVYYAFITLSTIGFGDYVPGQGQHNGAARSVYKVAVGFWIIVGLSFLALVIGRMTSVVETVVEGKKSEEESETEGSVEMKGDDDNSIHIHVKTKLTKPDDPEESVDV
jgi:hypothetical protein